MPQPLIAFPDAEKAIVAYLRDVQDVAVGTRNPAPIDVDNPPPVEFVRVRVIGGTSVDRRIDLPTLDAIVWAPDDERRMTIAQEIRAWLHAASGTATPAARLGGCTDVLRPRRMPDPANAQAEVVMLTVQIAMTAITAEP